jgi:hypothetical protein
MPPDSRDRANSSQFESDTQRRRRLIRNRRQRELYGVKHHRRRKQFARRIERGEEIRCSRYAEIIGADMEWDLGHDDRDPSLTLPEHRSCNRAAANRLTTSRVW